MKLKDIIQGTDAKILYGTPETQIDAIVSDSRKAAGGAAFFAVKGHDRDGHDYIDSARAAGASAIVSASRKDLALCAANFYGHPSEKLSLVGITGTNGKTTTVTLLYNLFMGLGYNCGLLSTIANYVGRKRSETENTTADPITINRLLKEMTDDGCEYCFMEVSSIGVEQDRVAGLKFKLAIFSNLTH
ncbi:MAG: UDP-N-acetylmuramoyl-L-alanyl-D-glutamate--2,6-diaminopimelate ligase, partial [Bacteroidales bacterium]|nr:UDP-N-acetylmuramoyl-L-alanyl-D-glutamate--2,6-diaminopimelate ligase [Bacteroidales bacterium]